MSFFLHYNDNTKVIINISKENSNIYIYIYIYNNRTSHFIFELSDV